MIEPTTNDALMQEYRLKIKRLTYELDDQRVSKRIAIGVAVAIALGWTLYLVPVSRLKDEYIVLKDESNTMAQTIGSYSAQIDAYEVEIGIENRHSVDLNEKINAMEILITELESQIPQ